jgi:S1-C subfamily serine protease
VSTAPVTADTARQFGLQRPEGLVVTTVTPSSPAAQAGLRPNDVILRINGVAVNENPALTYQIASRSPGETVPIEIRRGGRAETLRARLEATPELPQEQRTLTGAHPLSGATVANLSSEILDAAGVSALNVEGVLVVDPGAGYAGRRAGFRRFDLITEVNGRAVRTVGELQAALASAGGWRIGVRRGGRDIVGNFEAE